VSLLDAHPTPKPGAYWPDGFRERAQAAADKVAAERDARDRVADKVLRGEVRMVRTGRGYEEPCLGDWLAAYWAELPDDHGQETT